MKKTKGIFRTNWLIGTLTVLSTGVLLGCEYCGPLLLAAVTGIAIYRITKLAGEAVQAKSITN